jgi:stage II sporulation protein D
VLKGAAPAAVETEFGEDVTREVWLLDVAGVFGPRPGEPLARTLGKPVKADTLRAWTTELARLSGRPAPTGRPMDPKTLGKTALALTSDLGWTERSQVLLTDTDLEAVLRDPKAATLPADERRALTYLAQQGVLRPAPNGSWPFDKAPSGATIAAALVRIGDVYDVFDLDEATVVAVDGRGLSVVRGQGSATLPLTGAVRLFTAAGSRNFPVGELQLWPGDRIRYHLNREGRVDLLELRPPTKGLSDDRSAAVYAWEVRKTGEELEEAVNKRVSVGTLVDLRVVRRGVSGRIVELSVIGSKASTIVKGFDVRNLLDLRESLTVIELQKDASGRISSAVFAGKGWGHGVGLCQVGAYGMAMRGSDYKEILAHYYPGTSLSKGDPAAAPVGGGP